MTKIATLLLPGLRSARQYSEDLLKSIPDEMYARKIKVNGKVLEALHPAFHIGHLATYPQKILTLLQQDITAVAHPKEWDEIFIKGSTCYDDPDNTIYPVRAEIEKQFFASHDKLLEIVPAVPDEVFFEQNPFEASRARFETAGQFAAYLLGAHIMTHLGQLSTWRRCAGLDPVY